MINAEMIKRGMENGVVKLIDSPNDGEPACQIGEHWFYYACTEGSGTDSEKYIASVGMEDVIREIVEAANDLDENELRYYESILKPKDPPARIPFLVDILEEYHQTVIIYAKDYDDAENIANTLCNCGEIDMDRNCYGGRTVVPDHHVSEEDLRDYDVYCRPSKAKYNFLPDKPITFVTKDSSGYETPWYYSTIENFKAAFDDPTGPFPANDDILVSAHVDGKPLAFPDGTYFEDLLTMIGIDIWG